MSGALKKFIDIYKVGGTKDILKKLYYQSEIRTDGKLVGTDKIGNKYITMFVFVYLNEL